MLDPWGGTAIRSPPLEGLFPELNTSRDVSVSDLKLESIAGAID